MTSFVDNRVPGLLELLARLNDLGVHVRLLCFAKFRKVASNAVLNAGLEVSNSPPRGRFDQ